MAGARFSEMASVRALVIFSEPASLDVVPGWWFVCVWGWCGWFSAWGDGATLTVTRVCFPGQC